MPSLIRAHAASTDAMLEAFGDAALLRAALRFEAGLARARADLGLLDPVSAKAIEAACAEPPEIEPLAAAAAHAGTLAIPLVALLRARIPDAAIAAELHKGATSQDLADTVLVLQAKAGMALIRHEGHRLRQALATLTEAHLATPMLGRTLLQPALPITFGLKTAQWLAGIDDALARSEAEAERALRIQLGGATGSLADLDGQGLAVSDRLAEILGLAPALAPWHARREALAGLASALAILVGAIGKIARDLSLLAQAEVAEAFEPRVTGRGGSSAMAHKRNPTACQTALSAALRAPHLAATLVSALPQAHERDLGGWQAEGPVLAELFALTHGALAAMAPAIEGLEVRADRMADNLATANLGLDTGESETIARRILDHYRSSPHGLR
ncbi:3-carboxy-cis,cis-muconate cycloisomerase [Caulobacter sp. BP25]|uniref:3-carboxy-cis,cis-muconate cycloisomerase n=1 Tax=Caulobacter sp. BP25 TaxID=2048900 RepID=UPI000C129A72|nr:3-carboxy-cis,cis-muconate cycloisomerase [Caulobacter sp. BP25]PHY18084.1 3-carboxy-cis,cis-muconate cycloisomerase [Caulobacter sp. BP25]